MLHGVASEGAALAPLATRLQQETGAQVVVLDHRGHGKSGDAPFRVAHVGQYEEDVADVVAVLRRDDPSRRVVLAGHSMGGGIALRFALSPAGRSVDGYLLIAPLFGGDSPTMRTASPEAAKATEAFVTFDVERLMKVAAANAAGDTSMNDLPIMVFKTPGGAAYGFNALQSMQPNDPQDYKAALAAIRAPLLIIAGSRDESFDAAQYPVVAPLYNPAARVQLIDGATHTGVLSRPESAKLVADWLTVGAAAPFTVVTK